MPDAKTFLIAEKMLIAYGLNARSTDDDFRKAVLETAAAVEAKLGATLTGIDEFVFVLKERAEIEFSFGQ